MRGATRISDLAYRASTWVDRLVEDYRYDDVQQREVDWVYGVMCAQRPERVPSERILRQIDAYAREVLGSPRFAPWLRVYTFWAGEFKEGWIPDNYFGRVVLPVVQGPGRSISDFKTLTRRVTLAGDRVPDLAYRVRGQWLDLEGAPVSDADAEALVFREGSRVVAKADDSTQGRGVRVVERGRDDLRGLTDLGDLVVQRVITPSDFMSQFTPDNLATLRITTVKPPGADAAMRGACLRVGYLGPDILRADHAIRVPVVDRIGTLGEDAGARDWTWVPRHPDTGVAFGGLVIPGFEAARETCTGLHDRLPHVVVIGWDVAFAADDDFYILEWNAVHPDIKFHEATSGPEFSDLGWEEIWKEAAPG